MDAERWIRRGGVSAIVLALGLAACGEDSTAPQPEPGAVESLDFAALAGELSLPGLVGEHTARTAAGRGDCTYNAATGWFECPPVTRDGITIVRSFALFDASGNPQSKRDALTTASVKIRTSVSGSTVPRDGNGTMTVDRSGELEITGLEGQETQRTHNGTEGGTVVTQRTRSGIAVESTATTTDETRNVVIPVPVRGSDKKWPLSGSTIHSSTTTVKRLDTGESRTYSTRRVVTYNGTSLVPVEITRNGTTRSCTLDLQARKLTCSS